MPLTIRAERVMEYAEEEAMRSGVGQIGTHHLLLALLREGEGIGAVVLHIHGVTLDDAIRTTAKLTGRTEAPGRDTLSTESEP
jgi:ATP-dependent Clp protease ATP-binding subunit ClpC